MPRRTSKSSRRFRRGKRNLIWTSVLFEQVVFSAVNGTTSPLVAAVDWVRGTGATFEKGAVLLGIRGWLVVNAQQVAMAGGSAPGAVGEFGSLIIWKGEEDEDLTLHDWGTATPYNDEDILWTGGVATDDIGNISTGTVASPYLSRGGTQYFNLEIKTKRKLNSDDVINLTACHVSGGIAQTFCGVVRSLIEVP